MGFPEHCEIRSTSSSRSLKPLGKDQIIGAVGVGPSSSHLERHGIQRTTPSSIVPWLSNLAGYEFQNTDFIGCQRHSLFLGLINRLHTRSLRSSVLGGSA